jgi:hypothetical protein
MGKIRGDLDARKTERSVSPDNNDKDGGGIIAPVAALTLNEVMKCSGSD